MLPNRLRLERIWRIRFGIAGDGHARNQIAESRKIFGGRVQGQIGAEHQRMLERRAEQRVVHHDHGLRIEMRDGVGGVPDVGHHDGGIGGSLDQDDGEILGRANGFVHFAGVSGFHGNAADAERAEEILDQMLRAAINRDGINDVLAGPREGEQRGHDGGHAGVENQGRVRAGFERHHARFQDFGVGVIEARVNQVGLLARRRVERGRPPSRRRARRLPGWGKHRWNCGRPRGAPIRPKGWDRNRA